MRLFGYCWIGFIFVLLIGCTTREGVSPTHDEGMGAIWVGIRNEQLTGTIFLDHATTHLETPDTLHLTTGNHVIHLFVPGYRTEPESLVIHVESGQIKEIWFDVFPTPSGKLQLDTQPSAADVWIDGLEFGQTPLTLEGVREGHHVLRFRHLFYQEKIVSIYIGPRKDFQLSPNLQPLNPRKQVLVEHFSNTDCAPCPSADATVENVISALDSIPVSQIAYHTNFPSPHDPFYLVAQSDVQCRIDFYQVMATPTVFVDGKALSFFDFIELETHLRQSILQQAQKDSLACLIDAYFHGPSSAPQLKFGVLALQGIPHARLWCAVVSAYVHYDQPPGTNGQQDFFAVFRGFLTGKNGIALQLAQGENFQDHLIFRPKPDWSPPLQIILFVQNDQTHRVLQSCQVKVP